MMSRRNSRRSSTRSSCSEDSGYLHYQTEGTKLTDDEVMEYNKEKEKLRQNIINSMSESSRTIIQNATDRINDEKEKERQERNRIRSKIERLNMIQAVRGQLPDKEKTAYYLALYNERQILQEEKASVMAFVNRLGRRLDKSRGSLSSSGSASTNSPSSSTTPSRPISSLSATSSQPMSSTSKETQGADGNSNSNNANSKNPVKGRQGSRNVNKIEPCVIPECFVEDETKRKKTNVS